LLSASDVACGSAIAGISNGAVGEIDEITKKTSIKSGAMIDCKQYVGGGGLTAGSSGSSTQCTYPSSQACTISGAAGTQACRPDQTWDTCVPTK
jgi:hypothetical protein